MGDGDRLDEAARTRVSADVVRTARQMLSGELGIIEGSRLLRPLAVDLGLDDGDPDFNEFVVVDSDTDHLPIGPVRRYWAKEALEEKDRERERYEEQVRSAVMAACDVLVARFGGPA